jgi:hypothetical protein
MAHTSVFRGLSGLVLAALLIANGSATPCTLPIVPAVGLLQLGIDITEYDPFTQSTQLPKLPVVQFTCANGTTVYVAGNLYAVPDQAVYNVQPGGSLSVSSFHANTTMGITTGIASQLGIDIAAGALSASMLSELALSATTQLDATFGCVWQPVLSGGGARPYSPGTPPPHTHTAPSAAATNTAPQSCVDQHLCSEC